MTETNSLDYCERCNSALEYKIKGNVQGLFCTKCTWSCVTTYMPEILRDSQRYRLYLKSGDANNRGHIKVIASITNLNFLQSKKLLSQGKVLILEDNASAINKVRKYLKTQYIAYEIEPDFPY